MNGRILVCSLLALGALGCGGSPDPQPDAGDPGTDSGTAPDSGSTGDAGLRALHGCGEADFLDRTAGTDDSRMIMVPRGTTRFDYPCMTIRAGQSVMFMWDFASHPLAPGVAPGQSGTGTEPTPIPVQTTGELTTIAFPTAGDYPYYCSAHHAAGMVGVVRVLP